MEAKKFPKLSTPEEINKKNYTNPYLFAEHLAGLWVCFAVDNALPKGQAKMLMHPDDYTKMKQRVQRDNENVDF